MSPEAIERILIDNQSLKKQNRIQQSKIGKAILYVPGRWKELTRFLEDGRIEFSNNWIENLFRLLALGRRNWLFSASENGARNLTSLYTILLTCKLHQVNSFQYPGYPVFVVAQNNKW